MMRLTIESQVRDLELAAPELLPQHSGPVLQRARWRLFTGLHVPRRRAHS